MRQMAAAKVRCMPDRATAALSLTGGASVEVAFPPGGGVGSPDGSSDAVGSPGATDDCDVIKPDDVRPDDGEDEASEVVSEPPAEEESEEEGDDCEEDWDVSCIERCSKDFETWISLCTFFGGHRD